MAEVTLTASMRANLYSLQQTANLMGTVQNRLSTGKKVNSALDNPNNYFTAQSLSNRASDINSLLDGMGQAIQAIKMATQGIESAQKTIDQMKAVANSALQSATTSGSANSKPVVAQGTVAPNRLVSANGTFTGSDVTTAGASSADSTNLLTNLTNNNGVSLGLAVGDTLQLSEAGSAATRTFTVTATSTLKDLQTAIESGTGATDTGTLVSAFKTGVNTSGKLTITATGGVAATNDVTLSGNIATKLGLGTTITAAGATPASVSASNALGLGVAQIANNDATHSLTSLTDGSGNSLGIANGDTLTYKLGTGDTLSFTVGGSNANNAAGKDGGGTTVKDLESWLALQGVATSLTTATITGGKLSITNTNTAGANPNSLVVGGKLAETLGVNGTVAAGGSTTASTTAYTQPQSAIPVATDSTLLRDLTRVDGAKLYNGLDSAPGTGGTAVGDTITIKTYNGSGGTRTLSGMTTITISEGMTVKDLTDKINAIDSKLKVSLNGSGQLVVDNQTAGEVDLGGTAQGLFQSNTAAATAKTIGVNLPGASTTLGVTLYAGYTPKPGSAGGATTIDTTKLQQFDTLRTQLNELVKDAGYQGINLISSANNSPLTVTFNEAATNASKLVINAVDMTSEGLNIKGAAGTNVGAWKTKDDISAALSNLTTAAATLRSQAAVFGTNLSTVQNRQDFAQNMIATLKEGADKLTLADMNEEGANMLALQTRSQLGTQSLSLASQANQAVMRLFG